ncbi:MULTISPECIES: FadR/GntR family transcriptional regulator [Prauserella salsuginis group]|uniref:DNA-binding FadR family transcriptional regulator n=2 Tax=Prauserella salsuginis group TaxID=2893672 RepID=A0A839XF20_9PSEU|nr:MULTISPECIES: FadR/GntR family transcriptional regulator [Prauserella salsuginis group]MBB3661351.1 DNA-binding FadR family transcriptional regulator [Prauserella sediminis]MCR3719273.1 DNA-binding transcriptional regulator, FadR family [Prauserella flava]MCR3735714.1 DNA-binding transcriptional regulator, FadR family [Prauserella salsuginis]
MPLSAPQRSGLVDQVIGQLSEAIRSGEWPLGERIPTEASLAADLGVGRNTVREAVRALAHSGLLDVRQGDGTYVRATSEVSGAIRKLAGTELREVLQVRKPLEVEGARLAALARTDDDLARLRELLDGRDRAWADRDMDDYVRIDAAFHQAAVEAAHNSVLTELYRGLTEVVVASVAAMTRLGLPHPKEEGHRGLLAALVARDADRAATEVCAFFDELDAHSNLS